MDSVRTRLCSYLESLDTQDRYFLKPVLY
jgi:hypothetical protein